MFCDPVTVAFDGRIAVQGKLYKVTPPSANHFALDDAKLYFSFKCFLLIPSGITLAQLDRNTASTEFDIQTVIVEELNACTVCFCCKADEIV